jgi:hypothetical protein
MAVLAANGVLGSALLFSKHRKSKPDQPLLVRIRNIVRKF